MSALADRLAAIETRLARLERLLAPGYAEGASKDAPDSQPPSRAVDAPTPPAASRRVQVERRPAAARRAPEPDVHTTHWMAVAASFAFLLGAVYFIKLVYDTGWLTPGRQVGIALLTGIGLIAGGLAFARSDRAYAAYLPALGVVVLYLALYAGHLGYGLLGLGVALVGSGAITLAALGLGRAFDRVPTHSSRSAVPTRSRC
jgi:uncharacterized membrane protein